MKLRCIECISLGLPKRGAVPQGRAVSIYQGDALCDEHLSWRLRDERERHRPEKANA